MKNYNLKELSLSEAKKINGGNPFLLGVLAGAILQASVGWVSGTSIAAKKYYNSL